MTRPPRPEGRPERARLARLLDAPHRLGFFAGAVLLAATASAWAAVIVMGVAGVGFDAAVPPGPAHGVAMAFAFMPLFITGFLFTAGPRWLDLEAGRARPLLVPVAAMAGGWVVALGGFAVSTALAASGIAVATAGWVALVLRFIRMVAASRVPDRMHAKGIAAAAVIGAVAMALATFAVAAGNAALLRSATHAGLWLFLAPIMAIVSHRMIPFFTAAALPTMRTWRPTAVLALMLAPLAAEGTAAALEPWLWPLPAPVHAALAVLLGMSAVALLALALRWGFVQSLRIRLLAMLHGGFAWLGIALALAAVSHALVAAHGASASLAFAPLHALTIGYLGATLFAMVTRVSAGHGGRPHAADDYAWSVYLAVQAAALLRVAGALLPAWGGPLALAAISAWAMACIAWAWRYGGWMLRPRADGRPG